ncbi:hypothetical protein EVAR_54156_1 [Eumeta japonica]|uniref:Uncharacterized protein n=1 Tax=Eumeta variegata TaxID=151549 RepID=A0A4C1Y3T7_EUMVA|nr:hypothetical protein EVAR_54156_1 [Eumeta japonica]
MADFLFAHAFRAKIVVASMSYRIGRCVRSQARCCRAGSRPGCDCNEKQTRTLRACRGRSTSRARAAESASALFTNIDACGQRAMRVTVPYEPVAV